MAELPTIRVRHGKGTRVINRSEFDPSFHEEHRPEAPAPKPAAAKKPAAKKPAAKRKAPTRKRAT